MDKIAKSFTNMFFRSARERAKQRDLAAAAAIIKDRLALKHPKTLNLRTGVITPERPNDQGKAVAEAIKAALEKGNVKKVKIF